MGKLSEAQRRHVDPQTWVGLLEHFCQYGKANLVTKVQQICKELELIVPDMVRTYVHTYIHEGRVHSPGRGACTALEKSVQPNECWCCLHPM